jgi:hypothetical protein
LGKLHLGKLHKERAVTGRIFQALPTQTDTTVALIYKIEFLPFGPPIWVKGGQQFAKAYGIKVRCYGEYVGEYIGNLGNILGTH